MVALVISLLQACEESEATTVNGRCVCPDVDLLGPEDFMPVDMRPFALNFTVGELAPFTQYCIQAVGNYSTEITGGVGTIETTSGK